jgi:CDGSH-type Zn-finger protein
METKKEDLLKIKVIPNAPLLVEGTVELTLANGSTQVVQNPHLCRCGASKNKPFCDGAHAKIGFKD